MKKLSLILSSALLAACGPAQSTQASGQMEAQTETMAAPDQTKPGQTETAIFAGGCFWCVESDFEHHEGVIEAVSGYTGGDMQNPTYRNHGQHIEAAKIIYDPEIVSYKELVDFFWKTIDPTDPYGQFCDKGHAYTTAIFATPDQLDIAKTSKQMIEQNKPFKDPIVTPVLPAKMFWDAEDYHQNYYKTTSLKYKYYRTSCGRDKRIKQLWGEVASQH